VVLLGRLKEEHYGNTVGFGAVRARTDGETLAVAVAVAAAQCTHTSAAYHNSPAGEVHIPAVAAAAAVVVVVVAETVVVVVVVAAAAAVVVVVVVVAETVVVVVVVVAAAAAADKCIREDSHMHTSWGEAEQLLLPHSDCVVVRQQDETCDGVWF
jgi:hypothetical protein